MTVEDAGGVEPAYHSKQRQLAEFQEGCEWKTATKETDNRLRCCFVEALEVLQTLLVVMVKDIFLGFGEHKGRKTTKELRGSVKSLYPERGSRVATVSSCKTSWEDSPQSIVVGRDSREDVGEIAMDRSQNPNMLSFITKGDLSVSKAHWRYNFPVLSRGIQTWGCKAEELSLLRDQLNMVLGTILFS